MQRILLKLALPVILVCGIQDSKAQEAQPVAASTMKGIWVFLGNEIPKDFQYQILRKQGNGKFVQIGTTSFSDDLSVVRKKMENYHSYFENLEKLHDADIHKMKEYASVQNTMDSIFIGNFPVMHLFFGTAFFDADAKAGNSYQYRVKKTSSRTSGAWEKDSNVLKYPVKTELSKPEFLDKQESAAQILLRWRVAEQKGLNSFNVYRRVFAQGDFVKTPAVKGYNVLRDSLFLIVLDTTVQQPGYYEYCVEPLDIYGNPGLRSDPAGAGTVGSGYNPLPQHFHARGMDSGYQVELSWKFEEKSFVRSIEVYRSESYDNGFMKVAQLPPSDTTYVDVVPVANENFWYYLKIKGPVSQSMPTIKIAAMYRAAGENPLSPAEVGAESVRGGVKVHWLYSEPHAKGFYVYRYAYDLADYLQVSDLIPAGNAELYSFVDSSSWLQGNDTYRYAVRTLNDVDQMSDFSPSASASPGIKATVKTPMNLRISPEGDGTMLIWDDLRNEEPSLLGYKLYKKTQVQKDYVLLDHDSLNNRKNYFVDSLLLPEILYSYAVTAIDFYGNESEKSLPVLFQRDLELPMAPEISRVVSTPEGIVVSWAQMTGTSAISVNLYRMQPGGISSLIATVPSESGQYIDNDVVDGQLYIYELSLITGEKLEGNKSSGVSVRR
jgi:fibronectin type 3 domain-containing protein